MNAWSSGEAQSVFIPRMFSKIAKIVGNVKFHVIAQLVLRTQDAVSLY